MLAFTSHILAQEPRDNKSYTHALNKILCVTYSAGLWYIIKESQDHDGHTSFHYNDLYDCIHPYVEKGKRYISLQIMNVTPDLFTLPQHLLLRLEDEVQKATIAPKETPKKK